MNQESLSRVVHTTQNELITSAGTLTKLLSPKGSMCKLLRKLSVFCVKGLTMPPQTDSSRMYVCMRDSHKLSRPLSFFKLTVPFSKPWSLPLQPWKQGQPVCKHVQWMAHQPGNYAMWAWTPPRVPHCTVFPVVWQLFISFTQRWSDSWLQNVDPLEP